MDYAGTTTAILAKLDTCLPQYQTGRPRNTELDSGIVEGILYKLTNNCKWRELPRCYPAWQTVYSRYALWCQRGVWEALWQGLAQPNADMEWVSMDATLVRANHLANGSKYCPQAEQALGRTAGGYTTKIHTVVDAHGNPLAIAITGGNRHDIKAAPSLVAGLAKLPQWLLADGGYDCKAFREELRDKGIEPVIPYRKTAKNPQPMDWHLYKERHTVECFFNKLKNYRAVAYRTCKTILSYQGFVALACYIMWHRLLGNKI